MTLPGGIVVDALRIREDKITLTDIGGFIIYDRNISYTFLGKNGEQVSVPSDTTEPNIGLIRNSASISWNAARVTAVGNEYPLPNKFSLEQNYPNPFNPSTSIQYAIDGRRFVSLKVFDVLGNEVATLVKEEKPTGVYEVNFNATQLSSGIYFYTLKAGSFIETKKLILMK
ncbi:MAG: T9SS type A sorting domain-containing protein [Ignavibacteriales bacterium]|nr:T9SS type A sorting domain-containing protein [Ignavibacteriales bacterium]